MRNSASRAVLGITLVALVVAAVLTVRDMRLASSQTLTLLARRSEQPVPADDPFSEAWQRASPVEVPLSAQNVVAPRAGSERTVIARALHDDERLYVLVEWRDPSEESLVSRQASFTDAVAVQFPATGGEQVPAFCMGDPNAPVDIWQWKASSQADIEQGFVDVGDAYPDMAVDSYPFEDEDVFYPARDLGNVSAQTERTSAAENLLAGSFGTLTQAPDQPVQGWGEWRNDRWRVEFSRDLVVDGDYSQFAAGESTNVAFAVWDGAAGERDGMKSVSQFLTLEISPELAAESKGVSPWPVVGAVLGVLLALALAAGAGYWTMRRQGA